MSSWESVELDSHKSKLMYQQRKPTGQMNNQDLFLSLSTVFHLHHFSLAMMLIKVLGCLQVPKYSQNKFALNMRQAD